MEAVYLFKENALAVQESQGDAALGTDMNLAGDVFGSLDFYEIPALVPGEKPIRGCILPPGTELPKGWRTLPVRDAAAVLAPENPVPAGGRVSRLFRAWHILQWRRDSAYCGSCGNPNGDSPEEPARLCPRCGRIEYPRISPAVITLVQDKKDRALLAHNKKFKNNVYSLIAGFAEAGESLEDAALREIKEEVNIEADELRYVISQSWPFPNSLMAGFTARYSGGMLAADGKEILDARWFTREEIRRVIENSAGTAGTGIAVPSPGSLSRFIINAWLKGSVFN